MSVRVCLPEWSAVARGCAANGSIPNREDAEEGHEEKEGHVEVARGGNLEQGLWWAVEEPDCKDANVEEEDALCKHDHWQQGAEEDTQPVMGKGERGEDVCVCVCVCMHVCACVCVCVCM